MLPTLMMLTGLGTGLNYHANKDLESLATTRPTTISTFWTGMALGGLMGLWIGATYGETIQRWYWTMDNFCSFLIGVQRDDDENNANDARGGGRSPSRRSGRPLTKEEQEEQRKKDEEAQWEKENPIRSSIGKGIRKSVFG